MLRPDTEDETSFVVNGDFGGAGTAVAAVASAAITTAMSDRLQTASASDIDTSEEPSVADDAAEEGNAQSTSGEGDLALDGVNAM